MSKWTKRKLFTFQFKDRPRRALLWRKSLYAEWFEYAKLSLQMGGRIPRAFGDLSKFDNFEDWWRHPEYGFELFCEPELGDTVTVTRGGLSHRDNTINFNVRLDVDPEIVVRDFKKLLSEHSKSHNYQSRARFQPSLPMKALKPEKLRQARIAFELSEQVKKTKPQTEVIVELSKLDLLLPRLSKREEREGTTRSMINPYHLAEYEKPMLDELGHVIVERSRDYINWQTRKLRLLSHHRRTVRESLKRIEEGTFP